MASQSHIMAIEGAIINTACEVDAARQAFLMEAAHRGTPWLCYPENRDVWGTLHANAFALREKLNQLLEAMSDEFIPCDVKVDKTDDTGARLLAACLRQSHLNEPDA